MGFGAVWYLCIQLDSFGRLHVTERVFLWEREQRASADYKPSESAGIFMRAGGGILTPGLGRDK